MAKGQHPSSAIATSATITSTIGQGRGLPRARGLQARGDRPARSGSFAPAIACCDLGCAPGSWLQYARTRIGDGGAMVGIDRVAIPGVPGARLLVGDVFTVVPADLLGELPASTS
jgi:hypothetical protein